MFPEMLDFFKDKKILIMGFGREGRSTHAFLRRLLPEQKLYIADKNAVSVEDADAELLCGENYLSYVNDFDIVMKSPGISFKNVEVNENTYVTCQVDLFLRFAPCKKVGVTGSKGKTTTSSLIYEMLKASGLDARLIGNIGIPVFEELERVNENTVAVIEMSSHQLEFTRHSPSVAVLTNVYEEHLDHYKGGFTGYVNAKLNIVRHGDENMLFICNGDQNLEQFCRLSELPVQVKKIKKDDFLPFAVENERLLGEHNRQDVLFAAAAASAMGATEEGIENGVRNFKGIEHRMEKVGTYKEITFYNDCIATIPHAVLCAVEALKRVDTLIVGGLDRGLDYTDFVKALNDSKIGNIIGTPETGHAIVRALEALGTDKNTFAAADLDEAVRLSYAHTKKACICLLSPAASSYNVYKNFEEKGRHYKTLVQKYGASFT